MFSCHVQVDYTGQAEAEQGHVSNVGVLVLDTGNQLQTRR